MPFLGLRWPFRRAADAALGRLERAVMEEVWQRESATGRQVHEAFRDALAYTTVVTTLDRLCRKGLLDRSKDGRAYRYAPRVSRQELETTLVRQILSGSLDGQAGEARPVLSCIVETVGEHDRQLLDELERLIHEKRREAGARPRR